MSPVNCYQDMQPVYKSSTNVHVAHSCEWFITLTTKSLTVIFCQEQGTQYVFQL